VAVVTTAWVLLRGGDGDGAFSAVSPPSPSSSSVTTASASAEATDDSPEPSSTKSPSPSRTGGTRSSGADRGDGLDGPYRLSIPRIGVDAPVVPIQTNAQRVLNPPRDASVVGWWSDGAAPGASRGSAVVVGHTVRTGGGVFDSVGDLDPGDTIEVEGSDSKLTYRVNSTKVLGKDDVARQAEKIFSQSGAGRLVVITCDDWDGTAWASNIVTVATPV
jgi:LPXTG-site transpeptidase (sortase) family protein